MPPVGRRGSQPTLSPDPDDGGGLLLCRARRYHLTQFTVERCAKLSRGDLPPPLLQF